MSRFKPIRWGDDDRYFGPLTFSRDVSYRPFAMQIGSGDGDEYPCCRLRISGFGRTVILALPAIIKPWRVWADTSKYSWSNNPDGGYWDTGSREYGFSLSNGHLSVSLGRVTNDSSTNQQWGCFLPWTEWRCVRDVMFDDQGKVFYERVGPYPRFGTAEYDAKRLSDETCPSVIFAFHDFDGEQIKANTKIGETAYRRGIGYFKWLSLLCKKRVRRSLDINFSSEVGKRKGSWKGGTIGHSISMRPDELHETAFVRYCEENKLVFKGRVGEAA